MKNKCSRWIGTCIVLIPLVTTDLPSLFQRFSLDVPRTSFPWGGCEGAETAELFDKDIGKQKENIEKEFEKLDIELSRAKLQEARSGLDVLEYKIGRMKKNLTKQEVDGFRQGIDKRKKMTFFKEDSLVSYVFELIRAQGVDAALRYTQNDLRNHGVAEKKINAVEKKILEDAPAMQQAFERQEIVRVINVLESGGLPDSSVNPYIIKSAQMLIKAKRDSVQRIEGAQKRKELEEQERLARARMKREIQEIHQKTNEEERLVKIQREQETLKQKTNIHASEIMQKKADEFTSPPVEGKKSVSDDTGTNDGASSGNHGERPPEPSMALALPEQPESKAVQLYVQTLKTHRQNAQEKVMELYGLLEQNQGAEVLEKFKQNRGFIAQYVDAQVFTILEQNIMQSVIDSKTVDSLKNNETATGGAGRIGGQSEISLEQEHLNRINGFLRDNKVEAAYSEFKRSEKKLKKFMNKNEFKQFKKMIENSYKTRHPGN